MAEMRSALPIQSTGASFGAGMGLPSSATTLNKCAGSEAPDLGSAAVQYAKRHALALLEADGLAVSQASCPDREEVVADFEAVRLCWGLVVGLLAEVLPVLDLLAGNMSPPGLTDGEPLGRQKGLAVVSAVRFGSPVGRDLFC